MDAPDQRKTLNHGKAILLSIVLLAVSALLLQTLPVLQGSRLARAAARANPIVGDCTARFPRSEARAWNTRVLGSNLSYLAGAPAHTQRGENFVYMAEAVKIMAKFDRAATLLDAGADVGKTTFPTLALPRGHRVLAVEPVAANVALLCRGAALNGWTRGARLTLVQGALSDRGGRARILVSAGRGGNAALPAAAVANARPPAVARAVRTLRGDALLTVTGTAPDVIKIDAQGRELRVLRGLREYLRKAPNALVIAGGDRALMRRSGADPRDIWELMVNELGYDAYGSGAKFEVVKGALSIHGVKPLSEKQWPPKAATDVFFLRSVAAKQ